MNAHSDYGPSSLGPMVAKAYYQIEDMLSVVASRDDAFDPLRRLLERSLNDLRSPLRVAFVGQIKASKSTLINALLAKEEAMHTGDRETTWNVTRLRFGSCDAPVRMVFRRELGFSERLVSRAEWADLAQRSSGSGLRDQVAFFEMEDDCPALRQYDIIDTPGLYAIDRTSPVGKEIREGRDSQNTREYLSCERPDAIVYLFSRGVSMRDAELAETFQGPVLGAATPVNAIGVLSRFDEIPLDEDPLASASRIALRWERHPKVRTSLHRVFPVCARLALGARTMTDADLALLKSLSSLGPGVFRSVCLDGTNAYLGCARLGLPIESRRVLLNRYTLFGLANAVEILEKNPDSTKEDLGAELSMLSGFPSFEDSLKRHFGDRAAALKLHRALAELIDYAESNASHNNPALRECLFWISRNLYGFRRIFRLAQQLDAIIRELSEGELALSESERESVFRLTGARGHALHEKLGLSEATTIETRLQAAGEGMLLWQAKENCDGALDPVYASFARTMQDAYSQIHADLLSAQSLLDGV